MLGYLEIGVRFVLGGWKGAPIWEKKRMAVLPSCCEC